MSYNLGAASWAEFSEAFSPLFSNDIVLRQIRSALDGGVAPWSFIGNDPGFALLGHRPYHGSGHAVGVFKDFEMSRLDMNGDYAPWAHKRRLFALAHDAVIFYPRAFPPMSAEHASISAMRWIVRHTCVKWDSYDLIDVTEAIMATALHTNDMPFLSSFAKAALDADLAGFATSYEQVSRNSLAIRQEFAPLSEPDWLTGRIAFFEALLKRKYLYYFMPHLEGIARENIERELAESREKYKLLTA